MNYRSLGKSGLQVSVLGLGGNRFGAEKMPQSEVNRVIAAAEDLGINFIDTANVYTGGRSEETLGEALKGRRDKFVVATKFFYPMPLANPGLPNQGGASRYHMVNAVEGSLRRLQSDHIDLYYVHVWDDNTPIEETLRALDDLVRAGKVLYLGASNFAAWQLAHANLLAEMSGWTRFTAIQNEYNLLNREQEREMLPYCAAHQVGMVPYFPLASGLLTGKYHRGEPFPPGSRYDDMSKRGSDFPYDPERFWDVIEALEAWCGERGRSLAELAIAWLIAKPQVSSVISGVTKLSQLTSNVKAAEWTLSADDIDALDGILNQKERH